jgi:hypothetical protein
LKVYLFFVKSGTLAKLKPHLPNLIQWFGANENAAKVMQVGAKSADVEVGSV